VAPDGESLQPPSEPTTLDGLIAVMRSCPQTPTQSVLQHGQSVWDHFQTMMAHLTAGGPLPDWWRLPAWTRIPGLADHVTSMPIMREYLEFHDCGKPFVHTVDAEGRSHFPGHAAASERVWLAIGGEAQAARLMSLDMEAHLLKGDGIPAFAARPEAVSLLLAALAEVHSNAAMFGGTDSDSFKIKAKHIDKRGRQVLVVIGLMEGGSK
jgi:hypothetical protein